jgi:mannose-6-phosphate isomerase
LKEFYILKADNFTPLSRTPWAGDAISSGLKSMFSSKLQKIGESWEFSCDPSFPSQIKDSEDTLINLIELHPEACLGSSEVIPTCEILLKIINAASPLSVQVHPTDKDSNLAINECGKPESWLILDANEGAGIYLGFSKTLTKDEIRKAMKSGEDCSNLLNFIPVKQGDYFEISPGLVHAIAPGTVILEPQRILPGKSGKTYRMWDWGRKYDKNGNLNQRNGSPRELHLEESLSIIDPTAQTGERFLKELKRQPAETFQEFGRVLTYPKNEYYQIICIEISELKSFQIEINGGYAVLLNGIESLELESSKLRESIIKGECVFIPAKTKKLKIKPKSQGSIYLTIPHSASLSWG